MNRRKFLGLGAGSMALASSSALFGGQSAEAQQPGPKEKQFNCDAVMPLEKYTPKSMLHVPATHVERARFPVIDFHTHITEETETGLPGDIRVRLDPENCIAVMDRKNVRTMVNLTGGYGDGLKGAVQQLHGRNSDRLVTFTEPAWDKASRSDYATWQAEQVERDYRAGAKGIKVLKTLGLYLRDEKSGALVAVDDKRFDPMWDIAGSLNIPVLIHVSDPEAFFLPIDQNNERWEELHAHPDWSFHGSGFPSDRVLQEARRNVMRRHPRTQFVCAHVASAENLAYVTECLDAHPNMHVDIAARISELGRQPRASRRFFEKFQDRIVFGTDASKDEDTPQQIFCNELYEIYFRFLETEDEYFNYAPSKVPPQGRWQIYGLGLPESILRKVYWENAARFLQLGTMPV